MKAVAEDLGPLPRIVGEHMLVPGVVFGLDPDDLGRRPLTQAKLTPAGKAAFKAYLDAIGKLSGLA